MKYRFGTLRCKIRRVQPLADVIKWLKAYDREIHEFGRMLGVEEVVTAPSKPAHTFEDSLLEVLRAARPSVEAIERTTIRGRDLFLLFLDNGTAVVDITNLNHPVAIQTILKEVLVS